MNFIKIILLFFFPILYGFPVAAQQIDDDSILQTLLKPFLIKDSDLLYRDTVYEINIYVDKYELPTLLGAPSDIRGIRLYFSSGADLEIFETTIERLQSYPQSPFSRSSFTFKIDTFINHRVFKIETKSSSNNKKMDLIKLILAPLLVAGLTGVTTWVWKDKILRRKLDAAPRKYVEELEKLIAQAYKEGIEKAVVNARSIVSTRNDLRSSLISISSRLNSEIDQLAIDIGHTIIKPAEPSIRTTEANENNPKRAYETIEVLYRNWPAKKVQIEVEIKKLLAELGLDPNSK
jgi:hypothetical protein